MPVKVGNSVIMANTMNDGTTIASVADMNDLIFRGNIDETEVGRVHEGMPVNVEFEGDSTFVYVLTDSVPHQTFRRTPIQVGLSDGIRIAVLSGITQQDKVRGAEKQ